MSYEHGDATHWKPRGGTRGRGVGETARAAKLTEEMAREIKVRLTAGESYKSIAEDYPVSDRTIANIKTGRSWGHVPWPT